MVELLKKHGLHIATAESCTGGLLGGFITSQPGASEVYETGFITYSNDAKVKLLGVSPETLASFGAVSSQTALEMSYGAMKNGCADIGVSVTGIAGPGGGTAEKPVGTVFISLCSADKHISRKLSLDGSRDEIRSQTVEQVALMIREYITELERDGQE